MISPQNIVSLRKKAGFSQSVIATQLGMARQTYIALEKGEREPSLSEASKLAELLGVSLDQLISGDISETVPLSETTAVLQKKQTDMRMSIPAENVRKFKEVFLYILEKVGGKPNVGQTVLYKLLYFIDFDYYEKYEEQLIGAAYMKNHFGPTPIAFKKIVDSLSAKKEIVEVKNKYFEKDQKKYLPLRSADLSVLNAQELAHIDWEIDRLSDCTATQISALSHKDTPWLLAKEKEILDYEFVFYRPEETSVREYEPL